MRRCFKKNYGVTPMQYLFNFRMREASRMLKSRQAYLVEMLSEYCGFSDRFYFSKCFKKQYGLTPMQYRKSKGTKCNWLQSLLRAFKRAPVISARFLSEKRRPKRWGSGFARPAGANCPCRPLSFSLRSSYFVRRAFKKGKRKRP